MTAEIPQGMPGSTSSSSANTRLFWTTALTIVLLDIVTKALAVRFLTQHFPHRVVGNVVRLTLAYNPGAAFSMSLGHPTLSRIVFGSFAAIALVVLWRIYRGSPAGDRLRVFAVALAWGGAAGNLVDRIVSTRGVVDFIDIGVGSVRFWTFNVADSAVTVGALVLAVLLWREDVAAGKKEEGNGRSEGVATVSSDPASTAPGVTSGSSGGEAA
jgi:signal peptidase II